MKQMCYKMYSNYLIGTNIIKNVLSTCQFYFLFFFTRNLNNKKLFCYILAKNFRKWKDCLYKSYKWTTTELRAAIFFLRLAIKFGKGCV